MEYQRLESHSLALQSLLPLLLLLLLPLLFLSLSCLLLTDGNSSKILKHSCHSVPTAASSLTPHSFINSAAFPPFKSPVTRTELKVLTRRLSLDRLLPN